MKNGATCTFPEGERHEKRKTEVLSASEFALRRLGFEADEKQRAVLDSTAKMGILNCTRQWGKSTVLAAKAVHRAWTEPGSEVLVSASCQRQSGEFLRKATAFARRLGMAAKGDGWNAYSLLFPNRSRIVALPGTEGTVRGFSAVSLLLIDEASRVPDAVYKSLRPMLAVREGDVWLMSTPYGKRGFFYEAWARGGPLWERVSVAATDCPRIPAAFLERERGEMGELWFGQEYLCQFLDNGSSWFGTELVDRALVDDEGLRL